MNEYDPSIQEAIDRSLRDMGGAHVTTETSQRPPPYNPDYQTRESEDIDPSTPPRHHDDEEEWLDREIEIDRERNRRGEISLDQLRLARVQRLSSSAIRGGASGMGRARQRRPNT